MRRPNFDLLGDPSPAARVYTPHAHGMFSLVEGNSDRGRRPGWRGEPRPGPGGGRRRRRSGGAPIRAPLHRHLLLPGRAHPPLRLARPDGPRPLERAGRRGGRARRRHAIGRAHPGVPRARRGGGGGPAPGVPGRGVRLGPRRPRPNRDLARQRRLHGRRPPSPPRSRSPPARSAPTSQTGSGPTPPAPPQ